jgi:uncharacterized membrane protein
VIGDGRLYDDDPRFGLVVLSEIAGRALSPGVNDPGTAIARDGAGAVEVAVRLQKALESLACIGNVALRDAAVHHARMALARAESVLDAAGGPRGRAKSGRLRGGSDLKTSGG